MPADLRVKRAYDPPEPDDGRRVLVDRLWPRGVSKERAAIDDWPKDVTPSSDLRKWYHADKEARFEEFVARYDGELEGDEQQRLLGELRASAKKGTVTLVTAAQDVEHSHVPVLMRHLRS